MHKITERITQIICTPTFTEILFTRAKGRNSCSLTDGCISKMWSIYTMEYYSAIRKKTLTTAIAWMNLQNTTRSQVSQTQKDDYCMIPPHMKCLGQTEKQEVNSGNWGWG